MISPKSFQSWFWNCQEIVGNLYKEFYWHTYKDHIMGVMETATTSVQYRNLEAGILTLGYVP